jgi:hypothetical protein
VLYSDEQSSLLLENMNSNRKWRNPVHINTNETKHYYQHLSRSIFDIIKPYLMNIKNDIALDITLRKGVITEGSGTLALDEYNLVLQVEIPHDEDKLEYFNHFNYFNEKILY